MTDLASLDTRARANEGAPIVLMHPGTGEPLDVVVFVRGHDSDAFREIEAKRISDATAKSQERARRGIKATSETLEEVDSRVLDLLAAMTLRWENLTIDGAEPECNQANARMVYERFPWIREQIDRAITDRRNFTQPPSTTS